MAQAAPVDLRILAINDFHGNLRPPAGGIRIVDPDDKSKKITVAAGGAEYMATLIKQLRGQAQNTIFVAAGDLIGASPFLSAMFHDEPTIESLSMMGLESPRSAITNSTRARTNSCGCRTAAVIRPTDAKGRIRFPAPNFTTSRPPRSRRRRQDGISSLRDQGIFRHSGRLHRPDLEGTPDIVSPVGVAGLEFRDEADTVNALVPELKARRVEAIVVLIHEGGLPTGDYNECPGISGPIVDIVRKFDKAVDVVICGHTHQAYVCKIDGRLVTSADKYGTLVTTVDLKLDPATRDVISAKADNVIVRTATLAKDAEQTALLDSYDRFAAPIANRAAGSITETLSRVPNNAGESALGNIIADAQLAATRSRGGWRRRYRIDQSGGIRTDIARRTDGMVSYADVFASHRSAISWSRSR